MATTKKKSAKRTAKSAGRKESAPARKPAAKASTAKKKKSNGKARAKAQPAKKATAKAKASKKTATKNVTATKAKAPTVRPAKAAKVPKARPAKAATAPKAVKAATPATAKTKKSVSENRTVASAKAKPSSGLRASEIAKLRERLEEQRRRIHQDLSKNREAERESSDEGIQDIADKASSAYSREFLYSLSDSERETLILVDEALARIDSGHYGICVACGGEVGSPRLQAVPWARHCLACQELEERGLLS